MTNTEKILKELEEINRKLNIVISDKSGTANCESAQKIEAEKSLNPKVDSKTTTNSKELSAIISSNGQTLEELKEAISAIISSKKQTHEELKEAISAINAISSPESATKAVTQACLAMGKALNLGIWSIEQRENIQNKINEVALFQISAPQLSVFIQEEMLPVITPMENMEFLHERFLHARILNFPIHWTTHHCSILGYLNDDILSLLKEYTITI